MFVKNCTAEQTTELSMPGSSTDDIITEEKKKKRKKWKMFMYHETCASASMRSMDYMAFEGFHLQLSLNWNTRALKSEKSGG